MRWPRKTQERDGWFYASFIAAICTIDDSPHHWIAWGFTGFSALVWALCLIRDHLDEKYQELVGHDHYD